MQQLVVKQFQPQQPITKSYLPILQINTKWWTLRSLRSLSRKELMGMSLQCAAVHGSVQFCHWRPSSELIDAVLWRVLRVVIHQSPSLLSAGGSTAVLGACGSGCNMLL